MYLRHWGPQLQMASIAGIVCFLCYLRNRLRAESIDEVMRRVAKYNKGCSVSPCENERF